MTALLCSLFQEPNACTLVDGEISPKGKARNFATTLHGVS
jgi:hypothetical protein